MLTLTYLGNNVSVDHGTEGGLCDKRVEASCLAQVSHVLRVKVVDPGIGTRTINGTHRTFENGIPLWFDLVQGTFL